MSDQTTKNHSIAEERIRRDFIGTGQTVEHLEELDSLFSRVARIRESILNEAGDDPSRSIALNLFLDKLIAATIQERLDRLTALATHDPLTGLGHRGAFDRRLAVEIERSRRYGRHFTLLLLDLDQFKQINDNYGHPAGDQVLIQFARHLCGPLRQSDEAFRIGGDEFALICPECDREEIEHLCERLRRRLSASQFPITLSSKPIRIEVSWGAAGFPLDAPDANRLIEIADLRLYEAKRSRRGATGAT
ncbi:MAG: GGDEF domain-containing protein [Blastocatellia bacterium]|jgi:diguanylate cyclase (GGDEF)-like protein